MKKAPRGEKRNAAERGGERHESERRVTGEEK